MRRELLRWALADRRRRRATRPLGTRRSPARGHLPQRPHRGDRCPLAPLLPRSGSAACILASSDDQRGGGSRAIRLAWWTCCTRPGPVCGTNGSLWAWPSFPANVFQRSWLPMAPASGLRTKQPSGQPVPPLLNLATSVFPNECRLSWKARPSCSPSRHAQAGTPVRARPAVRDP